MLYFDCNTKYYVHKALVIYTFKVYECRYIRQNKVKLIPSTRNN